MANTSTKSIKVDFYIDPNGNDSNTGTLENPFASLKRARNAVRNLKNTKPKKDIIVMLRGGYYLLSNTTVFNLQDSASDEHTITYSAYPDEQPIIGSGTPVTGWEKTNDNLQELHKKAKNKVWCAPIPEGIKFCTSLFQNQQELPRSRSRGFVPTNSDESHTQLQLSNKCIPADAVDRGMDMRVIPTWPWTMNLLPINEVNSDRTIATTSVPSTYPLNKNKFGNFHHGTMWIENAVEFLDEPGKWAIDIKNHKIYFWPKDSNPPSDILAPKLTELIRVEGEINYNGLTDTPVKGIIFKGITFMHADHWRWQEDKTGLGLQHDWEMFDKPTAMLRFRGAEDCTVEKCIFTSSGSAAIRCDLYSQKNRITRNHIHHIGGVGILLNGYGPGTKDVNCNNEITNNHIHNVGQVLWHAAGIFAWQSGKNKIAHNCIHHVPYIGIVVSGRIIWDRNNPGECSNTLRWNEIDKATGNASKDSTWGKWQEREQFLHGRLNIVEYNDIHHCMQIMSDGNGIYISGTGSDNQVRYNAIHDVDSSSMNASIRCDDDQHGTVINGNIITNCVGEGFIIKGANTISNNIIYGLRTKTPDGTKSAGQRGYFVMPGDDCTGAVVERNIFYAVEKDIILLTAKSYGLAFSQQCKADKNIYFNITNKDWGSQHIEKQHKHGIEKHSISDDPLFVNPDEGDFTLQEDSPALKLGFKPIDYNLIGLYPKHT